MAHKEYWGVFYTFPLHTQQGNLEHSTWFNRYDRLVFGLSAGFLSRLMSQYNSCLWLIFE